MSSPVNACTSANINEGKKEACKTYLEQTKLLVTLASAFLIAPAGLVAILKDRVAAGVIGSTLTWLIVVEIPFVLSVLFGYVVVATLAGSQDKGEFDVYRPATTAFSLAQFFSYVGGMIMFIVLAVRLVGHL